MAGRIKGLGYGGSKCHLPVIAPYYASCHLVTAATIELGARAEVFCRKVAPNGAAHEQN
jgi:hypothetical protein